MEGVQDKHQLCVESNNPVGDNQDEDKKLGLGFESPNLDDQTLDHELVCDQEDGLCQKVGEMGLRDQEDGLSQKKLGEVGFEDQDGLIGEKIDLEGEKNDGVGEKSDLEGEKSDLEGVKSDEVGEKNDLEGEKDHLEGEKNDFGGLKNDGFGEKDHLEGENNEFGGEKDDLEGEKNDFGGENNDRVGERNDFEGDRKDWGAEDKVDEVKIEESEVEGGEFKGVKEGVFEREGSKWSEIEEEEERNEYGGFEVKNDEWVAGEREGVNVYGDGWGEQWNDGPGRNEANEEGQQYFDDYENVGYRKEQYGGEEHWGGNVEGGSVGFNDGNNGNHPYPLRPDAEDCSFYMRTGTCKYGSNCRFNHPLKRKNQASRDMFKQREEHFDGPGPTECKYQSTPGGCKYGKACRYNHSRPKPSVAPIAEFNFLGLPMRVGEKECPYYMKTSSCKYGSNCRFNHPDPTVVGGGDSAPQGTIKDTIPGWSSARTLNENAPYMPVMYPPSPTAPPNGKWNEYQAPVYPTSERNLPTPPAFALRPMNIPASDANFYAYPRQQQIVDEFPERPGQPECSFYLKTGDCKYRATCKFHHPKTRKTTFTLSDRGLPLRPDQSICSHFSRYGICKYGPACKYDHSESNSTSAESDQRQPRRYGRMGDSDGDWRREPMQQSV
ncbi:Zinc finger, CCCH-type [Heracleum sosnowskyi]|uniref:Zinc finger, CCCH-type n=1 Tax=Heracleum sosnowskyi TaxID=360622 RepID=A0AAD8I2B1_9APIA|nr:Zinc finger, CCCH-type [Heracleum sosnowskyi]